MNNEIKISASLICMNLLELGKNIRILKKEGLNYIHYDIMDGHFVPGIGLGTFFLKELIETTIPLEVHLMVSDPEKYVDELAKKGVSMITFHYEIDKDVNAIIKMILKHNGIRIGIAFKPETFFDSIVPFIDSIDLILLMAYAPGTFNQKPISNFGKRIREVKKILKKYGKDNIDIAIDGGITIDNIKSYYKSGANFFVLGKSGLFLPGKSIKEQLKLIKNILI